MGLGNSKSLSREARGGWCSQRENRLGPDSRELVEPTKEFRPPEAAWKGPLEMDAQIL